MQPKHGGLSARNIIELKPTEFIGQYQKNIPVGNGIHLIKAGTGCGKTTFMTSVYESNRNSIIVFPTKAIAEQVKIDIRERDANNANDTLGLSRVVQLEHFAAREIEIGVPVLFDEVQLFKEHGTFRDTFGRVAERIKKLAITNPVYIVTGTWTDDLERIFNLTTITDFVKVFNRKVGFIELTASTSTGDVNGGNLGIYTRSLADIIVNTAIEFADIPTMFYLESREKLRVISDMLTEQGLTNIVVTSCKEQPDAVKRWFKSGNIRDCGVDVILCTSVVAEGINVKDGANIICMPDAPERLVQRFGRNRINSVTGESAGRYFLVGSSTVSPLPKKFSFENPDVGTLKQVTDGFSGIEDDEHREVANEFKRYQEMCREGRYAQYIWANELPKYGYHADFDCVMEHARDSKDMAGKSVRMRTAVLIGMELLTTCFASGVGADTIVKIKNAVKNGKLIEDSILKDSDVNAFYKTAFSETCNNGKSFKLEFTKTLMKSSSILFETAFKRVTEIDAMFEVFTMEDITNGLRADRKLKAMPLEFLIRLNKEAREWCVMYNRAGRFSDLKSDFEVNDMGMLADLAISNFEQEFTELVGVQDLTRDEMAIMAYETFSQILGVHVPDKWKVFRKVDSDELDFGRTYDSLINLFALLIGAEVVKVNNVELWRYERQSQWWCEIPQELKRKYYKFNDYIKESGRDLKLRQVCEAMQMTPVEILQKYTPAKLIKQYDEVLNPKPVIQKPVIQKPVEHDDADWGIV